MEPKFITTENFRAIESDDYNMVFRAYRFQDGQMLEDGQLLRWGKDMDDDPTFSPYGAEIADIEISSGSCPGILKKDGTHVGCAACYKGNSPGKSIQNMTLETYKKVLDKLLEGPALSQVALGVTGVKTNPDLISIMRYTASRQIFPNLTITGADLDYEMAVDIANLCGAIAISCSPENPDLCYDTVKLFTDLGVQQTNIHVIVSAETMDHVNAVLDAQHNDPRLKNMNAVVGLLAKPKGRAVNKFHPPKDKAYRKMIERSLARGAKIGFDSCSAPRFVKYVNDSSLKPELKQLYIKNSDPCESLCFSIYVNVCGRVFPCSFSEPCSGWGEGLDILAAESFINDIWMHPLAVEWRKTLLFLNRECPTFPEIRSSGK